MVVTLGNGVRIVFSPDRGGPAAAPARPDRVPVRIRFRPDRVRVRTGPRREPHPRRESGVGREGAAGESFPAASLARLRESGLGEVVDQLVA